MRLSAWDLTIERGGRRIFAGLSFAADQGVALIVTGPNGSGKSTLLRALCGFLPLEAGGFALEGGDSGAHGRRTGPLSRPRRRRQRRADRRREPRLCRRHARRPILARRARAALARVGLAHVIDFPARLLSAGQRRRVALARLLIADRPLWLLDEPATALDAAAQVTLARDHAGASARRRNHRRRYSCPARARGSAGTEARRRRGGGDVIGALASGNPSPCGGRWTREARPDEGSGAPTPLPQGERGGAA